MDAGDTDELRILDWVRGSEIGEAACVTLVAESDLAAVVRGFGGRPASGETLTLRQAEARLWEQPVLAARQHGSWVLGVEINGWQGSRPEVLTRVSRSTQAVSAYWNVNGVTRFSYARTGQVLTAFETMSPDRREGTDPDVLEPLRAGLPWENADWVPLMLALVGRVTGEHLLPSVLAGEFRLFPLTPWPEQPRSQMSFETAALTYDDPSLAWALRDADDEQLSAVARAAAVQAARTTGLADEPAIVRALSGRVVAGSQALDALAARIQRQARDGAAGDRTAASRFWAVTALREAANPVPLAAAFETVAAAYTCASSNGDNWDSLRLPLLDELGNPEPPSGSLGLKVPPGASAVDRYQWITRHWLAPAGWLLFVKGVNESEFARSLRADGGVAGDGIPALAREPNSALKQAGNWCRGLRWGEPKMTYPTLQHISQDTVVVSATWSGRGRSWIHYLQRGQLVVGFDPLRPDQRVGQEPAFIDGYLDGLPVPVPQQNIVPVLLAIAERLTGIALTPESLDEPQLLVSVLAST